MAYNEAVMSRWVLGAAGLFGLAALAPAQGVRVYSEFVRVRPDGEIFSSDRTAKPREILSPATARNAYATFRVVVDVPPGQPYTIYIGQNPDNSCEVTIYRESYEKVGEELVPDGLVAQPLPVQGKLEVGQRTQSYLLDVLIPESTKAGRFRLEVQLYANDRWTIYPLEMRPRAILCPLRARSIGALAPLEARSDAAILPALRESLCKTKRSTAVVEALSARALLLRNIRQDLLLAESRMPTETFEGVAAMLLRAGGYPSLKDYCAAAAPALPSSGPEWWLRARDYVYQGIPVH